MGGDGEQVKSHLRALSEAIAHPTRTKLLFAVAERGELGATAGQLAERTGEPQRKVRYHLDSMVASGLVSVAAERNRRGVRERLFRVNQVPLVNPVTLDELSDDQRQRLSVQVLKAIIADASAAVRADYFSSRAGHSVLRIPGEVDRQGWNELSDMYERGLVKAQAIIARSRERLNASGEEPILALNVLLLFEAPPWPPSSED